jgi:mono/diheme cytochrome c family protein
MKCFLIFIGIILAVELPAQDGPMLFQQKCAACHTIGKGRLVGPDLKDITVSNERNWLIPFIRSSQTMIQSGDAQALAIYKEYNQLLMPDAGMNDAEIEAVLIHIEKVSTGVSEVQDAAPVVDLLEGTTKENINQGAQLFSGRSKFSAGGMACSNCHTVKDNSEFTSGTLAKELTTTYEMMGSAGIAAIIKSPPFPAMKNAYSGHALTEEEVINLTAYLKHVSQNRYYQHSRDYSLLFVILGIFFSMVILIFTFVLYFKHKRGSVRDDIYQRQTPVIN